MIDIETCPLCEKKIRATLMEIHHYIPQSKGGTCKETMRLCGACHDMVHYYIPIENISLYKTPESLKTNQDIKKYLDWSYSQTHVGSGIKKILRKMQLAS